MKIRLFVGVMQARQVLWGVAPGWFDPALVTSDHPSVRLDEIRFAYGE